MANQGYTVTMEREPRDFGVGDGDEDRALDASIASLPPCSGLPSTAEEIAAADARAEADLAAGRVYPHEVVGEWLKTWGTDDRKPFKEWLAARNG